MVGVFPATLSVAVRSTGQMTVNAGVGVQTATISSVPTINGDLYAEAGIGSEDIFIGIKGGAELLRERLIAGATLQIIPTMSGSQYRTAILADYKGHNAVSALKGNVSALVKASSGFEQKLEIYSWPGYVMDTEIFNGTWRREF